MKRFQEYGARYDPTDDNTALYLRHLWRYLFGVYYKVVQRQKLYKYRFFSEFFNGKRFSTLAHFARCIFLSVSAKAFVPIEILTNICKIFERKMVSPCFQFHCDVLSIQHNIVQICYIIFQ
jgi:hypothetical protein